MARYDDLNTKTIGYLTFLSSVLVLVIILLLHALCYNWIEWQEENKLTRQSYQTSNELIDAQRASLNSYTKVQVEVPVEPAKTDGQAPDGAKPPQAQTKMVERVHIPIERAKELVLEELRKSKSDQTSAPST